MNTKSRYFLICLVLSSFTGGCATFSDNANPDAGGVAADIHQHLNAHTRVVIHEDDARGRLLRAYYLITVFSVYGNASIERYSHSPSGDAGGLLGRIMAAETALQAAWKNTEKSYYPVDRARVIFSMADLAAKAIRPTVSFGSGLLIATPIGGAEAALDIFKNAVKDVIYGEAYLEGFHRSIRKLNGDANPYRHVSRAECDAGANPPSSGCLLLSLTRDKANDLSSEAWTELAKILASTCDALKRKAKLESNAAMKCGDLSAMN